MTTERTTHETVEFARRNLYNLMTQIGPLADRDETYIDRLIVAVRAELDAEVTRLRALNARMARLMRDWVGQYDHESGCGVSWGDPPETCVCLLGRARTILAELDAQKQRPLAEPAP